MEDKKIKVSKSQRNYSEKSLSSAVVSPTKKQFSDKDESDHKG